MKSSILTTLLSTLIAKLSPSKMFCIVSIFCAATAILSPAQTKFTSLWSFSGPDGADPYYVNLIQGTDGSLYGTTHVSTGTGGTVFKITTGGTLTTLHTFCSESSQCLDGAEPDAGLVLATNGTFYGTTTNGGASNNGTVFGITSAGTLTTLHSFDLTDGGEPEVALIQGTNGDFYGTTTGGGTGDVGTIFQITSGGTFTSLHSFDGPDGDYPNSRLVQGTNGNFYGTTYEGGGGSGSAYEITSGGTLTTLHSFDAAEADGNRGGLIQASNGNFYGTAFGGGIDGGTVFEMTPAGTVTVLYNFCSQANCTDGQSPYAGLIQATDGNLYGTTFSGGAYGWGTVFEITTAGRLTTLYSFCSQANCADGSSPQGGLLQDTNGTFYGTTYHGGTNSIGTIFSLSTGLEPFVKTLPNSGQAGTIIIILGTNLTGATKVSFNGVAATFTVISSTEIQATVPSGATTGTVTVVTPSGTLKSNPIFTVPSQIKKFTPTSGPVGTSVTITGVGLKQTTEITFAGVAVTDFAVDSNTKVIATVPADAKTGTIVITTPGGTATSTASFTVTE